MRLRSSLAAPCFVLAVALFVPACGSASLTWNVLRDPINAGELSKVPWGTSSYWLQPWRSALVTRSATALESAIGINFNVTPQEARATARLLHDSGVRRARLEVSWNSMSYADPTQPLNPAALRTYITALRDYGIRPLILLNSNHGAPVPNKTLSLTLKESAAQGATSVSLDSASAAQVVPGLTGINENGVAAEVLIKSVGADGRATLSQPLPAGLPAGPVEAMTLAYAPFAPPYLADGSPNPRFQQALAGWLTYAKSVAQFVRDVYGSDNFDVEVWNEMSFGSDFLFEKYYYNPVPDPGSTGDVPLALLTATVQMFADPANGLTHVKVGDGFAAQVPWATGKTVPPGTAAIDKHPYINPLKVYPGSPTEGGIQALDALGKPATAFTPTFRAFFPEFYLTGIKTETLMRDLSPNVESNVYGYHHGAKTHSPGYAPPAMWITEDNLDWSQARANGLPAADLPEFQAKAAMRFYVSYASEGAQAIDLFAAKGSSLSLISPAFFSAVDRQRAGDPGRLAGQTMQSMARLTSTLSGAQPIAHPRQLSLTSIAQAGNDSQFTGNGTSAYPSLYNRNVLAFFPFQVSQNKFVAAVYVMTRDLTHRYASHPARGLTPFDLPPEQFRLTIGNVPGARAATVSLSDPLTGTRQPATIISRTNNQIVVQLDASDSPRMLTVGG